ncbi:DNA-binding transcriptional regulator [bacterium]|nr:DNA-binding transcriptional regulator [bacterium]
MSKSYKSNIFAAIHETVSDLHDCELVDKVTMKKFDDSCLTKITPITPNEIKEIRINEGVSQSVFAKYLNITKGLDSQWERGEKKPSGASLKLLSIVNKLGLHTIA